MENVTFAQSVPRGCGTRKGGGVYAECWLTENGEQLEHFILCPPIKVDPKEMGLSPVGVKFIEQYDTDNQKIWHVFDWVGSKYYPNVADFLEEVRRFGLSRRISKDSNFGKLTSKSRILLLHSNAWINDPYPYQKSRVGGHALGLDWEWCPKEVHGYGGDQMCAGLHWENVTGMERVEKRVGTRIMPAFQYPAGKPAVESAKHSLAIFASFPIARLAVVQAEDGSHEATASAIEKATSLPVAVVEE